MENNLKAIVVEYQAVDTACHMVRTADGQLYAGNNKGEWQSMALPTHVQVQGFHFTDAQHGAVVGTINSSSAAAQLTNDHLPRTNHIASFMDTHMSSSAFILVALVAWMQFKRKRLLAGTSIAVGCALLLAACGGDYAQYKQADAQSTLVTRILRLPLSQGFHHFAGNGSIERVISITEDAGQHWTTHIIPSNFEVRDVLAMGRNFFVANFAAANHPDGDVWIYGNDSTYSKALSRNVSNDPYHITCGRGLNGTCYDATDNTWMVYGSEKITKFPLDENSSTDGNILVFPASLENGYTIIDLPGENEIVCAHKQGNHIAAITTDGNVHLFDGKAWKSSTPESGKWKEVLLEKGRIYMSNAEGKIAQASIEVFPNECHLLDASNGVFLQGYNSKVYSCSANGELSEIAVQ